jgi:glyoxylase-like metal-dependent hydrolase (beta-lactamase superfamily II)
MIELSRRNLLAGAAAATALSSLSSNGSVLAAAPPAAKQANGFYRYKLGAFEVTVVTDGARVGPLADNFVRNAKKDDVNAALQAGFQNKDELTIPFNPNVINTGSKLVAIDTGLGLGVFAQSKGKMGQYQSNLAASGIDAKAIDVVIISHFHGDHINGLLTADNKPAFPNAEIMVPAPEWAYWMDDGTMSRAAAGLQGNFKNVRRVFGALGNKVTKYDDNKELAPGIVSLFTPGHTPGHSSHVVTSGSSSVLLQADVTNIPSLFVRNPGWHAVFDMDGPMAEATRRKLYDRLAADRMLMGGYHYPFPAMAHIEKDGTGYRPVPIAWNPTL